MIDCYFLVQLANAVDCVVTRKTERQADLYAKKIGYGEHLKEGLVVIKIMSDGFPSADPLYSIFYQNHYTLVDRLDLIDGKN